jgi:hypothetical protein
MAMLHAAALLLTISHCYSSNKIAQLPSAAAWWKCPLGPAPDRYLLLRPSLVCPAVAPLHVSSDCAPILSAALRPAGLRLGLANAGRSLKQHSSSTTTANMTDQFNPTIPKTQKGALSAGRNKQADAWKSASSRSMAGPWKSDRTTLSLKYAAGLPNPSCSTSRSPRTWRPAKLLSMSSTAGSAGPTCMPIWGTCRATASLC